MIIPCCKARPRLLVPTLGFLVWRCFAGNACRVPVVMYKFLPQDVSAPPPRLVKCSEILLEFYVVEGII